MNSMARTIRGYIFWTYDRGSLQYDIMVTLILAFIFISPRYINFNDKPIERTPHQSGVIVNPDGKDGFYYEIPASAVGNASDVEAALLRVIEPIAGEVRLIETRAITNSSGKVVLYRVRVRKP
jgi:hypothetical protein